MLAKIYLIPFPVDTEFGVHKCKFNSRDCDDLYLFFLHSDICSSSFLLLYTIMESNGGSSKLIEKNEVGNTNEMCKTCNIL